MPPVEFVMIRKNVRPSEEAKILRDIVKLHTIRGRLLNLSTILENCMKEYLKNKGIHVPMKIVDYKNKNGVFDKFLDDIKKVYGSKNKIRQNRVKTFERHFRKIAKARNDFAHGFVYYKNPKPTRRGRINNVVLNKYTYNQVPSSHSLNKQKTVFDDLNKSFESVIIWLAIRDLLSMKGFAMLGKGGTIDLT